MKLLHKMNENGRSMVEMLGVLAIIGVLSIGGITGYTIAMRKYRANEIIEIAAMLATLAETSDNGAGKCLTLSDGDFPTQIAGLDVRMMANPNADVDSNGNKRTAVTIQLANEDVCTVINDSLEDGPFGLDTCSADVKVDCSLLN